MKHLRAANDKERSNVHLEVAEAELRELKDQQKRARPLPARLQAAANRSASCRTVQAAAAAKLEAAKAGLLEAAAELAEADCKLLEADQEEAVVRQQAGASTADYTVRTILDEVARALKTHAEENVAQSLITLLSQAFQLATSSPVQPAPAAAAAAAPAPPSQAAAAPQKSAAAIEAKAAAEAWAEGQVKAAWEKEAAAAVAAAAAQRRQQQPAAAAGAASQPVPLRPLQQPELQQSPGLLQQLGQQQQQQQQQVPAAGGLAGGGPSRRQQRTGLRSDGSSEEESEGLEGRSRSPGGGPATASGNIAPHNVPVGRAAGSRAARRKAAKVAEDDSKAAEEIAAGRQLTLEQAAARAVDEAAFLAGAKFAGY